jgi:hypothetical protein
MKAHERSGYSETIDEILLGNDKARRLKEYLLANSKLPGPRANLELANAFADALGTLAGRNPREAWEVCLDLCAVSAEEAPSNSKAEFLTLCGTVGLGSLGVVGASRKSPLVVSPPVLSELKRLSHDPRWRTREAVAIAIQRMLAHGGGAVSKELKGWISDEDWLQMRAVVVGVAEPPLLRRSSSLARTAFAIHKVVISKVQKAKDRKSSEFKVLRQALGFSLSVVVAEIGDEGFEYMHGLASSGDHDLTWVLEENLKKDRLRKDYPEHVIELGTAIQRDKREGTDDGRLSR